MALLLNLDKNASKDLNKLSKDTLEQMFCSYKQNALNAQIYLEQQVESARKHAATTSGNKVPTSPRGL
jgi:hypothetical protein